VALPFTLKKYLQAKEELWKQKIFHHATNIMLKKTLNPSKAAVVKKHSR
jgi:hypothetical protein